MGVKHPRLHFVPANERQLPVQPDPSLATHEATERGGGAARQSRRSSLTAPLRAHASELLSRVRRDPDPQRLVAGGLTLGRNVYIGRGSQFDGGALWLISVGDDVVISAGVEVIAHDASMRRRIGYSLFEPVTIGHRVYVGAGAIILPGTMIGDDTVVGAGAVVRGEVPARSVVAGNPARVVSSLDDFLERHRRRMTERPVYPKEGWTAAGGITPENMRRMREDLSNGPGYAP